MNINPLVTQIISSLKEIRISLVTTEYILQDIIKEQLEKHNIYYIKEYKLAPRKRVDFFFNEGIALEVKKGKTRPNRTKVYEQLEKYSQCDEVKILIYVGEKNVDLPLTINGKPCYSIALTKNWGISL